MGWLECGTCGWLRGDTCRNPKSFHCDESVGKRAHGCDLHYRKASTQSARQAKDARAERAEQQAELRLRQARTVLDDDLAIAKIRSGGGWIARQHRPPKWYGADASFEEGQVRRLMKKYKFVAARDGFFGDSQTYHLVDG